jgi:hypothetical protein
LTEVMITNVDESDPTRAGAVKVGPLQGEPDVDVARISVEIYHNDPENPEEWVDEIVEWEMPRNPIWARRFTILWRALLVDTREELAEALDIASTLKARIEGTLFDMSWVVTADDESVVGPMLDDMTSEMIQGGGPGEHDWSGKVMFDVLTMREQP